MDIPVVNPYISYKGNDQKLKAFIENIFSNKDAYASILTGKIMIRSWAKTLNDEDRISYAHTFMLRVMEEFWDKSHIDYKNKRALPLLFSRINYMKLDDTIEAVANAIGASASRLPIVESSYLLGLIYTSILPDATRTTNGVFYTPPSLTNRLLELADRAGVDWSKAKVLDPACGGGAFLAPICLKMLHSIKKRRAKFIVQHIQQHLHGWDIDPFAGWLSQVFVEIVLKDVLVESSQAFHSVVKICNSLEKLNTSEGSFDLVIGNPPYGKLKLTDQIRQSFGDSLYGHANLYGIFTHLALKLCKPNAVVAYLTPTSFLSGEYFKKLRAYIRLNATPVEMDFVLLRKGVFDDVLQETMLTVYVKTPNLQGIIVNEIETQQHKKTFIHKIGEYTLPNEQTAPWILPRSLEQADIVNAMKMHRYRLTDWGYGISTGPLVWNRHKLQLTLKPGKKIYPIIWAESISFKGEFKWKSEKVNHKPYFRFEDGDEWLVTKKPCILLQRTTAKEQNKRLIAAEMPLRLVRDGVVVENHLNIISAKGIQPKVPSNTLSVFLNSEVVNRAFSSLSGSVAVSAYELESLPLPHPSLLKILTGLISSKASIMKIEKTCEAIYKNIK